MGKCCMNAFTLKLIAVAAMTIDHVGYLFFPSYTLLRVIGRITFPIMGFFIAHGFMHTRSVKNYALRLLLFSLISVVPCYMAFGWTLNIFLTLLGGLAALAVAQKCKNTPLRLLSTFGISVLTLPCDWGFSGVWLIYVMGRAKSKVAGIIGGVLTGLVLSPLQSLLLSVYFQTPFKLSGQLFRLGMLMAIPLLLCYNQKRGPSFKYFFYIYYPAHLLVLATIKHLL